MSVIIRRKIVKPTRSVIYIQTKVRSKFHARAKALSLIN